MSASSPILSEAKSLDVLLPAILFVLLSPGLILSLPSKAIHSMATSPKSVAIHGALLALGLHLFGKYRAGVQLNKYDLLVPALLFIVLSPGLLFQLPPGAWQSGSTSLASIAVHALLFALLYSWLRVKYADKYTHMVMGGAGGSSDGDSVVVPPPAVASGEIALPYKMSGSQQFMPSAPIALKLGSLASDKFQAKRAILGAAMGNVVKYDAPIDLSKLQVGGKSGEAALSKADLMGGVQVMGPSPLMDDQALDDAFKNVDNGPRASSSSSRAVRMLYLIVQPQ